MTQQHQPIVSIVSTMEGLPIRMEWEVLEAQVEQEQAVGLQRRGIIVPPIMAVMQAGLGTRTGKNIKQGNCQQKILIFLAI